MVDIEHRLLSPRMPGARIARKRAVEFRIGTQRVEEGRLVIGAAAHPAVGQTRPGGNGIALAHEFIARAGGLEKAMRDPPRAASVGVVSTALKLASCSAS